MAGLKYDSRRMVARVMGPGGLVGPTASAKRTEPSLASAMPTLGDYGRFLLDFLVGNLGRVGQLAVNSEEPGVNWR